MPPKTRITKEMILCAAFDIAREKGADYVNARTVSERLSCSTQPVMYSFATMDDLRREVYKRAEEFQTQYINSSKGGGDTMLDVGTAYVRFAAEEKNLFKFLFQSNHFSQQTLGDVIQDPSVQPLIETLSSRYGIGKKEAEDAFSARFLMVHGMASMLANNAMEYDEDTVRRLLELQFNKE